jgi:hypothetical protein
MALIVTHLDASFCAACSLLYKSQYDVCLFVRNVYFLAVSENTDRVGDVTVRLPFELSMDVNINS